MSFPLIRFWVGARSGTIPEHALSEALSTTVRSGRVRSGVDALELRPATEWGEAPRCVAGVFVGHDPPETGPEGGEVTQGRESGATGALSVLARVDGSEAEAGGVVEGDVSFPPQYPSRLGRNSTTPGRNAMTSVSASMSAR